MKKAAGWSGSWRPRLEAAEWAPLLPEQSADLVEWNPVEAGLLTQTEDGSLLLRLPLQGRAFLRLRVAR